MNAILHSPIIFILTSGHAHTILDKIVTIIADNVRQVIDEINNKPVYTIHELLEGKTINPRPRLCCGRSCRCIAPGIAKLLGYPYKIPEHSEVANALGAALARTTAEITSWPIRKKEN